MRQVLVQVSNSCLQHLLYQLQQNRPDSYIVHDRFLFLQGLNTNLGEALIFLRDYDTEASNVCFKVANAQWNYATNMTDINKRKMIEEQMLKAKFDKVSWKKAILYNWPRIPDPLMRRQLKLLITKGRASLPDEKFNEVLFKNVSKK